MWPHATYGTRPEESLVILDGRRTVRVDRSPGGDG